LHQQKLGAKELSKDYMSQQFISAAG